MKEKIDNLDFIKIRNPCFAKDTLKRMERQVIDWERIFAKHLSDKGFVSKIYLRNLKINSQRIKKWQKI